MGFCPDLPSVLLPEPWSLPLHPLALSPRIPCVPNLLRRPESAITPQPVALQPSPIAAAPHGSRHRRCCPTRFTPLLPLPHRVRAIAAVRARPSLHPPPLQSASRPLPLCHPLHPVCLRGTASRLCRPVCSVVRRPLHTSVVIQLPPSFCAASLETLLAFPVSPLLSATRSPAFPEPTVAAVNLLRRVITKGRLTKNGLALFCSHELFIGNETSRVFSTWFDESSVEDREAWHEIARPQVHGHDINCVAIILGKGNHRFLSGAEEKVARVFEVPLSFLKTLNYACSQKLSLVDELPPTMQILGANMSALGLSQKPTYAQASAESHGRNNSEGIDSLETIPEAVPVALTEPPIEEQLAWHTLWPESHKLYSHGNELFSVCSDHEGKLVASSCKAQSASLAEIWLWQVGSWMALGRLHSHTLTV